MHNVELQKTHVEIDLPQKVVEHLELINNVPFTHREIDILACILNGRSTKKIASFLSISTKTVESHIRNIMLKTGCRSQEGIIDFLERSEKYSTIKQYYLNLLVASTFQAELIRISKQPTFVKVNCLLAHGKEKGKYLNVLEKNLTHGGHTVLPMVWEGKKTASAFLKKIDPLHLKYIIWELTVPDIEKISINDHTISIELISTLKLHGISVIFLLPEGAKLLTLPRELHETNCIYSYEVNNYYLTFEILRIIMPELDMSCLVNEFKKKCEMYQRSFVFSAKASKQQSNEETVVAFPAGKRKWIFMSVFSCVIILILFWTIYFVKNDGTSDPRDPEQMPQGPLLMTQIKTGKNVNWNLPRNDQIFIGRTSYLKKLHQILNVKSNVNKEDARKNISIVACSGLGGIGKTLLALQYIYNARRPYTIRAWFPAEDLVRLEKLYLDFAKGLGYNVEKINVEESVEYVKQWLQDHPGWLLVFDNVDQYEDIAPFLPSYGGNVLITTRHTKWPTKIHVFPMDIMESIEAKELIKRLSGKEGAQIENLASTLGNLPLALAQASAYIREKNKTITQYLELYKLYEQKLLADETLPIGSNHSPVAITWDTSISAIEFELKKKNKPIIVKELLTTCSYLAPENIPINVLLRWLQKTYPDLDNHQLLLDELLSQLTQYSLINLNIENQTVSLHRILQSVLRNQRDKLENVINTNNLFSNMANALDQEFWHKSTSQESNIQQLELLPHMQKLENYYDELSKKQDKSNLVALNKLLHDIGHAFQYVLGQSELAKLYYERSLILDEQQYEKNHFEIGNTLTHLGRAYRNLGDVEKAKGLLERALLIKEKRYGKDHLEVANTLTALGGTYRDLGDPQRATEFLKRGISISKKYYNADNPALARTFMELAGVLRSQGKAALSKELLEHSAAVVEKNLGKNAFELADNFTYLGSTYRALGNAKQAREVLEDALKIKEKYYGKDHFSTALTLVYLGNVYRDLGDYKIAKELLERALIIREKHYGKDHFEVANTKTYLAFVYRLLGDLKKAREYGEESLIIKEKHYGKDHFEVSVTLNVLGTTYKVLGNTTQAIDMLERALAIREKHYGKDNFETAITLTRLGSAYLALGNSTLAKELLERALFIKEQHYDIDSYEIGITLTYLGDAYIELGRIDDAKKPLDKALRIKEIHYGKDHFQTALTLDYLGKLYLNLNNAVVAKEILERSLAIKEKHYGTDHHVGLINTLKYLNQAYIAVNEHKQAELGARRLKKISNLL